MFASETARASGAKSSLFKHGPYVNIINGRSLGRVTQELPHSSSNMICHSLLDIWTLELHFFPHGCCWNKTVWNHHFFKFLNKNLTGLFYYNCRVYSWCIFFIALKFIIGADAFNVYSHFYSVFGMKLN